MFPFRRLLTLPLVVAVLSLVAFLLLPLIAGARPAVVGGVGVTINEIRGDQPGTDNDEYFELVGTPGTSLDGLSYVVIGDGTGGSGVIEAVVDLTGQVIPADGYFVAAESTFSFGTADLTTSLNFENSDNVTHLLVAGLTASNGTDLDTNDDGTLDLTPWSTLLDLIALVEEENPPGGTEYHYGPPAIGPDGGNVPGHVYRCAAGWQIGDFNLGVDDSPGGPNPCPVTISEIRIDQPGTDNDEYFELSGAPGASLDGLSYLVIGDGTGGSGVIEAVVDLTGTLIPASGYFLAAEGTFSLGSADLTTSLNFENSDNVTHLLVSGFLGANGDDLDTNDDGVLDVTPWAALVDLIALVEEPNPPTGTEFHYGPPAIGPDGSNVPAHVYDCPAGWQIGPFDPVGGEDTPGAANSFCPIATDVLAVDKSAPAVAAPGDTLAYDLTLDNLSTGAATDVVLTDTLPAGATYLSDTSGVIPTNPLANVYVWDFGSVPSLTQVTFELHVALDGGLTPGTVLTNTVSAVTSSVGDDPANNSASAVTTLLFQVRIHDIQGAAHLSPLENQPVGNVPGIVTVVTGNGFWMQEPLPDGDEATSEGIFVFTAGTPGVAVGDAVEVSGTVAEFYPGGIGTGNLATTEITGPTVSVISSGNPLPAATVIGVGGRVPPTQIIDNDSVGDVATGLFDPAEDGIDFYESLEGMRVQVNDAVVVGPTSRFGEIGVLADNGAAAGPRTIRGGIHVTPTDFNPERIIIDDALVAAEPQVDVGQLFTGPIVGVMDYSFGMFKLLNSDPLPAVSGALSPESAVPAAVDELRIASFNVENLDPGDGVKFDELADQLVNGLLSPDIVAVQEVQDNSGPTDDGVVSAAATYGALIAAIQTAGGPLYDFRDIAPANNQDGGQPGGNIRVGFLFRTDRVTFVDRGSAGPNDATAPVAGTGGVELSLSPGRLDPTNIGFANSRKPLAGEFLFNGQTVIVVNNHFNSKGGDDPLFGRIQPPVRGSEVQRQQQAQVVNDFVDAALAIQPNAAIVVLGDLNDFDFSPVLETVTGAADGNVVLTDLIANLPAADRYTFLFEGNSQVLDHVLVPPTFAAGVVLAFDVVHANAEFAEGGRATDHEPLLLTIDFTPPPPVVATLTYLTVFNNNTSDSGIWTLRADGTFMDDEGRSGQWNYNGMTNLAVLSYDPGGLCTALFVGRPSAPARFFGRSFCRDGSGATGFWAAQLVNGVME